MSFSAFRFNYAIVCRVPNSFADRGVKDEARRIDVEESRREHRQLVDTLRKCEVNIIELQEDEDYKDCCSVEDCAVIIGGVALIARPGLKSRHGEVIGVVAPWFADLPLVLKVPGSIPAHGEENFGAEHAFPSVICRNDTR